MEITERIQIVSNLQQTASNVFKGVAPFLKVRMNELEIAELIKEEFKKCGIIDFWYNVPIIVLIGTERFMTGANSDYAAKNPSKNCLLKKGDVIYIDMHPQDSETGLWGDWNTMVVFQPRKGTDDEQVTFLEEMREIHREGISKLTPNMMGADIMSYYLDAYKNNGITPILGEKPDIGHTIHEGLKVNAHRLLLNTENTTPIGGYIYAIEPAGSRPKKSGDGIVVGRFEECVYIPKEGNSVLLGSQELLPLVV